MEKKFDIAIACGNFSDVYVPFLLTNLTKTMHFPKECHIILGINNYRQFDLTVLDEFKNQFSIEYHYVDTDTLPGSAGHGLTLNAMLEKMTAFQGMFLDCDMAFLSAGWDKKFRQKLSADKTVGAFGLAYPNETKYQGWPSLVACSFNPQIVKKLGIDFRPLLDPPTSIYTVQTIEEEQAWGHQIGTEITLDCGYRFPLLLHKNGLKGLVVPYQGTGRGVLGIGQEYWMNEKPFATHLKGSSVQNKYHPRTVQWMQAVNKYISKIGL